MNLMKKRTVCIFLAAGLGAAILSGCAQAPAEPSGTPQAPAGLNQDVKAIDEIAESANPDDFSPESLEDLETQE